MRTVGELARLAGVTVRTLHHYDEIGLLSPSGRSEAGYRLYAHHDLVRLQSILVWRHLGFALPEIAALLDDPAHDRLSALRRQRELVARELTQLGATAAALDKAITAAEGGIDQEEHTMFKDLDHAAHEEEARQRWGDTDAYRESARRTAGHGEGEWAEIRSEAESIEADYAAVMAADVPATDERARAVAERHRQHMTRWFYPVSPQMHRNLAEMYVADPRFTAHYERVAAGLAEYVRAAINANADAQETAVSR
jgi:DNA-binding transcriptional MerR regulator